MATLRDLERDIRSLVKDIPQNASNIVAKAGLAGLQAVVSANPVDTGRSRGNWFLNVNAPTEAFVDSRRDSLGPGAIIAQTVKPDDELHLTNNTSYINKLNAGSSAQAPAGFIEDAVVAAARAVATNEGLILRGL